MNGKRELDVYIGKEKVGTLAETDNRMIAFSYESGWLNNGYSISPFSLPLRRGVFVPKKHYFSGLFGVFSDSLPDAWGRLLMQRMLASKGIKEEPTALDMLAIVGCGGMGILDYVPEYRLDYNIGGIDYDVLVKECHKILSATESKELDTIFALGGLSGGARPKLLVNVESEAWIVKFPLKTDASDIGRMEYEYSLCAKKCKIKMTETRLFPSKICDGYFGTKRFDRELTEDGTVRRKHIISVAGLLKLDYGAPSLDYRELLKLTDVLTIGNKSQKEQMLRLASFNVFAHNRDDHSKNFSFIYDETMDIWQLAPAYDLTYSTTFFGEHTTSVDGNGRNPGVKELLSIAGAFGFSQHEATNIIEEVRDTVFDMLAEYIRT